MVIFEILAAGFIAFNLGALYGRRVRRGHGEIVITENDSGKKIFTLELGIEPEDLEQKKDVLFKIVKE